VVRSREPMAIVAVGVFRLSHCCAMAELPLTYVMRAHRACAPIPRSNASPPPPCMGGGVCCLCLCLWVGVSLWVSVVMAILAGITLLRQSGSEV
jgi:hypothetical protein